MKRDLAKAVRDAAMRLADVEEGIACAGTSLEKRTVKVRGKAFLFFGSADLMLKLRDSLDAASDLMAREPEHYRVGAHGWVTVALAGEPPLTLLLKWVDESYRLFAPKQGVASKPAKKSAKVAKGKSPAKVAKKSSSNKSRKKQ
jgi:hypothetical protein